MGGEGKKTELCLIWKCAALSLKECRIFLQEATCPGPLPLGQICLMGAMRMKRDSEKGLPLANLNTCLTLNYVTRTQFYSLSGHLPSPLPVSWCCRNPLALQVENLPFLGIQSLSSIRLDPEGLRPCLSASIPFLKFFRLPYIELLCNHVSKLNVTHLQSY